MARRAPGPDDLDQFRGACCQHLTRQPATNPNFAARMAQAACTMLPVPPSGIASHRYPSVRARSLGYEKN